MGLFRNASRPVRLAGNILFTLLIGVIGLLLAGFTILPGLLHYQSYVVLSGSMEPAIHTGSMVLAVSVPPESLQVGDVISFIRPGDQETITHRIVTIKGTVGDRSFVTQGDANNTPDPGDVRYDRLAGKVVFTIPYLGYIFRFLAGPGMRVLFVIIPGLIFLSTWLWEIWRPKPGKSDAAAVALRT